MTSAGEDDLLMSRGLSASELEQFPDLLQRFAEHELDQFENWRFDTRYGPVYVSWARKLLAGWPSPDSTASTQIGVNHCPPSPTGACSPLPSLRRPAMSSAVSPVAGAAGLSGSGCR